MATVFADSDKYPSFADPSGGFVYARLMMTDRDTRPDTPRADPHLGRCRAALGRGEAVDDLPRIEEHRPPPQARDVFAFFISGAKERAPGAATAMLAELGFKPLADAVSAQRERPRGRRGSTRGPRLVVDD